MIWLRQRLEELALAITFLTRLPCPAFKVRTGATLSNGLWAFPLAGLIVGFTAALALAAAILIALPPAASAIIALITLTWMTGALHEDGLADMADGIGGGRTTEQRLQIMRDSRIGTYGALALIAAAALAGVLLTHLIHTEGTTAACRALIVASCLSRTAIALPLVILRPARQDGLAAGLLRPAMPVVVIAVLWPVGLTTAWLGVLAAPVIMAVAMAAAVTTWLAWRSIGGTTGDVYGATVIAAFIAALLILSALPT